MVRDSYVTPAAHLRVWCLTPGHVQRKWSPCSGFDTYVTLSTRFRAGVRHQDLAPMDEASVGSQPARMSVAYRSRRRLTTPA